MLCIGPIGGICATLQREIASLSEMPENAARALAVVVVDLEHPVLVSERDDEVAIARRVHDCVGMGPIGKGHGMADDVQVIELVPDPNWLEVRIEIDDNIAEDIRNAWISRKVSEGFEGVQSTSQCPFGRGVTSW